ncbi:MAG: metal-dependent hydrolase, partial [Myxococcales bacterium]|nr:metal-dependent hydrolase [Myxococcales bacterium]
MQTYTHLLIGAALGACLHPSDLVAQGACAAGAMLPDVAQVPSYLLDRSKGRQPLATVRPEVLRAKFAAHSLLVWATLLAVACVVGWPPFLAFCAGGLSHPLVDALTHKEEKYWANDAGFLWPLS